MAGVRHVCIGVFFSWLASATARKLPIEFEPNSGKARLPVRFLAHTASGTVRFLDAAVEWPDLRMRFSGSKGASGIELETLLPGVSSYFIGRERALWVGGVRHFARVRYRNIYPGIDA